LVTSLPVNLRRKTREKILKNLPEGAICSDDDAVTVDNGDCIGYAIKGLMPFPFRAGDLLELFAQLFVFSLQRLGHAVEVFPQNANFIFGLHRDLIPVIAGLDRFRAGLDPAQRLKKKPIYRQDGGPADRDGQ
jgi:hypothetical protein